MLVLAWSKVVTSSCRALLVDVLAGGRLEGEVYEVTGQLD